ncbi:conditioned medium factor receptor 1-like isoform X2 [Ostrea edulis]|uniref:conditioned medium factor receptor 1-like isoform X2 n=1 Tax=Ostrea edulis TaxID=37623 RepID=UPI002095F88E|nr:conditioned medium factor receptor 1-like isoform X2 [Ostrea edulis]
MECFEITCLLVIITCILYIYHKRNERKIKDFASKFPKDKIKNVEKIHYDVAICGAGPAGSTCAYYLAKLGWKCLLLEKKKFPRDKYCGDAVCKTAIEILMDMGVYDQLIQENKAHVADSGGLCSPGGLSYVGRSKEVLGEIPAAIACKRLHLDDAIAKAAHRMCADLQEDWAVNEAKFDNSTGLWTISRVESTDTFQSRVLVCADGAPSRLATQLGLISRPPDSTCSRAYVEGGTHKFKADGVVFYNKEMLPASLRLGGEKVSFGDHVLVVGDAAGMIDPLTGEGIHHAMEGGKMAALFLDEAIKQGNYDNDLMKLYHQRWMNKFGFDFKWSMIFCQAMYRFPILLDASAAALKRKGDKFLAKWADIMTGRVPKIYMLKPEFSLTIGYELIRLLIERFYGSKEDEKKTQ